MKKLLFVCLGNICRSPSAEGIMRQRLISEGMENLVYCDSAGTSAHHRGQRADQRMIEMAKLRGYDLLSISRPVSISDFVEFDHILAMDSSNLRNLRSLCPNEEYLEKIVLISDYCSSFDLVDVPDPYYGGELGFDLVLDLLEDSTEGLIKKLRTEVCS